MPMQFETGYLPKVLKYVLLNIVIILSIKPNLNSMVKS